MRVVLSRKLPAISTNEKNITGQGVDLAIVLPRHAGVQRPPRPQWGPEVTPLVRGLGGQSHPKNIICVVLGKWCDMWGKWTVRLELLPTALHSTEADATHRMK